VLSVEVYRFSPCDQFTSFKRNFVSGSAREPVVSCDLSTTIGRTVSPLATLTGWELTFD
jgi:hypothetical protein